MHVEPEDWNAALADVEGPQLVVGGPGTGKTEFLARRARHLIEAREVSGGRVLMLTFSRRAAADLRTRVAGSLAPDTTPPRASTFHSLAFRILETHAMRVLGWSRIPALLTGPEHVGVVRRLLADEHPDDWPVGFRDMLTTRTFAKEVTDFLLRAAERRLGPDDIGRRATTRADWRALPAFMDRVATALDAKGRMDYATVLSSAISVLDDPTTQAALAEEFRYVLVDEYQDTTDAQAALLHRLVAGHGNLTVTADVAQSIYSFRGADLHNVERFATTFADLGPVTTRTLTTSFRVPSAILGAARTLAVSDLPGAADDVRPSGPGGRVDTYVFDQHSHEAEWIAGELERLHLEERIPYRRMAVLVRTKRRLLPELSRALERRGIPHERPDARLIDHPAIRVVVDLVELAVGTGTAEDDERSLRRFLLGPLAGVPLGVERGIVRALHRGEVGRDDLIRRHVPDGGPIADLLADPRWATTGSAEDGFWHAWTSLPQWIRLALDPARDDFRVAWSSFSQVLGRLAERDPDISLREFLHLAGRDEFEASPLLRYSSDADRLTLTTLHAAKGLEFEVVIIADAVDGVLPDLRRSYSLLNTNQLHPDQQGTAQALRFRVEEERRLAYTAMTRATTRVVWTATGAGIEETDERPSRFMYDIEGAPHLGPPVPRAGPPVTGLEAEALLRRTVSDPLAAPAARLAALHVLVDRPHPALRPIESFAGVRPRGPDHGLVPDQATFSPSQAAAFDSCPRQYAFGRHLGIGDEPSVYMHQGSLIHRVAEILDRRVLDDPDHEPTVAEALAVLDEVFDPAEFGGGPWAEAWRRRAADTITKLLELAPQEGRVLLVEHSLAMRLSGETWRGRADRIERLPGGGLRIVDYKTTGQVAKVDEAAGSLQLGFYVLAASQDPTVTDLGTIDGAELWYPAAPPLKRGFPTRRLDMDLVPLIRERLVEIARAVRAEEFPPIVSSRCRSCRVRLLCDEWPEGEDAFTP